MRDGNGTFYCYPIQEPCKVHAVELNMWNNPKLKYVVEEFK
jgi:hypothetical protein